MLSFIRMAGSVHRIADLKSLFDSFDLSFSWHFPIGFTRKVSIFSSFLLFPSFPFRDSDGRWVLQSSLSHYGRPSVHPSTSTLFLLFPSPRAHVHLSVIRFTIGSAVVTATTTVAVADDVLYVSVQPPSTHPLNLIASVNSWPAPAPASAHVIEMDAASILYAPSAVGL